MFQVVDGCFAWRYTLSMKLEDLDVFKEFEIWNFDDSPAYFIAWNKETFREERLYLDNSANL